ncbi:MAG: hypothetical protein M1821_004655 [Bathelium mastoideum]|nr:MAG: hypothetical protein M1821_004655 [Bathelium mastoideum]
MVTRARGKHKTNVRASSTTGQPALLYFDPPIEASKKRRADENLGDTVRVMSTADEVKSLKTLILCLLEKEEERVQEIRELRKGLEQVDELRREVQELRKLLKMENVGRTTYAAALKAGNQDVQVTTVNPSSRTASPNQRQKLRVGDDKCSVTVNTTRFKGEKADFV